MEQPGRRILLAVEPGMLEGALGALLSTGSGDDVVQVGRKGMEAPGHYDAAVVSDKLPDGVRADVLITLPDTRGSGGTGTVSCGDVVYEVTIAGAERVVELLEQYVPRRR